MQRAQRLAKTNTWSDGDGLLGDGTRGVRDLGECHEGGLAAEGLRRGRAVGLAGSGATCHPRRCLHSNAASYLIAQRVLSNQNTVYSYVTVLLCVIKK